MPALSGLSLILLGGDGKGHLALLGIAMLVISPLMIWRMTRSYLNQVRVIEKNEAE